jgi:hypothetical protein
VSVTAATDSDRFADFGTMSIVGDNKTLLI